VIINGCNVNWTLDKYYSSTEFEPWKKILNYEKDCYRQFFRLVTSKVSVWYDKHSTKNPLGIFPGSDTQILYNDKFI
jgi:hypothetical protein